MKGLAECYLAPHIHHLTVRERIIAKFVLCGPHQIVPVDSTEILERNEREDLYVSVWRPDPFRVNPASSRPPPATLKRRSGGYR